MQLMEKVLALGITASLAAAFVAPLSDRFFFVNQLTDESVAIQILNRVSQAVEEAGSTGHGFVIEIFAAKPAEVLVAENLLEVRVGQIRQNYVLPVKVEEFRAHVFGPSKLVIDYANGFVRIRKA